MRHRLANLAPWVAVFQLVSCDLVGRKSPEAVFKSVAPSVYVVTISNYAGPLRFGSAIAIAPDILVTNKHVVGGDLRRICDVSQSSRTWRAFPTYFDLDDDLCLLWVPGLKSGVVALRDAPRVSIGEHVLAVGSPKGLELSLSEGLISGIRQATESSRPMYQTTAPIAPGSSGGGLLDLKGRLVGITTLLLTDAQNIGFAIPADAVKEALSKVGLESSKALLRAAVLMASGRGDEARPALETAVREEPRLAVAWLALGNARAAGDDLGEECLRRAVEADPSFKDAWLALQEVYSLRASFAKVGGWEGHPEDPAQENVYRGKEKEALQKALDLDPADLEVAVKLATSYEALGLLDAAEGLAKRVLAVQPTDLEAWNIVGNAYTARGQQTLAYEAYREVVKQRASTWLDLAKQSSAWFGLAKLAQARNDRDEARACSQKGHRLSQESWTKFNQRHGPSDADRTEREKQAEAALTLLRTTPHAE